MYVCMYDASLVLADPMASAIGLCEEAASNRQDQIRAEAEVKKLTPEERGRKLAELIDNAPDELKREDAPKQWDEIMMYITPDTNYNEVFEGCPILYIIKHKNQYNVLREIVKIKSQIPPNYLDVKIKYKGEAPLENVISDHCTSCDYGEVVDGFIRLGMPLDSEVTYWGTKMNPLFMAVHKNYPKTVEAILRTDKGREFAKQEINWHLYVSYLNVGKRENNTKKVKLSGKYNPLTLAIEIRRIIGEKECKEYREYRLENYTKIIEMLKKVAHD